uniref:Uncharacterized protein n=1 Tax=Megaselia scalaris TaxID=36166 RepID=T1GD51_MEGSC
MMKLLLITSVLAFVAAASASKVVFCYYGTWSKGRPGNGKFTPANIDPNLCTHLGYSFFGINDNDGSIISLDSYVDFKENWGLGYIQDVVNLKKVNPKLKVIAVVGGYNEVSLLQQHGFDGLDLDWEYPAQRGGAPQDKANFVTWLKEIKTEFNKYKYLLTIAVGSTPNLAGPSYDIAAISLHLDLINLMTYDLHGSWESVTGMNSPLYSSGPFSIEKAVNYWLNNGAPASKLTVGLAAYGRTFTLANPSNNGLGAPSVGAGTAGQFTREGGFLGYNEICLDKSWNVKWDQQESVPYAYQGNQWVGYDNPQSIAAKAQFALSKNLAGVMIWSIETDDFRGDCGAGAYPLLKTAFSTINGGKVIPPTQGPVNPTTRRPNPPTQKPVTKPQVGGSDSCGGMTDGYFRSNAACNQFYQCVNGYKYDYVCPGSLSSI